MIKIYAIRVNKVERYIGKTIELLNKRLNKHLSIARTGGRTHLAYLLRAALRDGKPIDIEWVDEVRVPEEWQAVEAAYIQAYREEGFDLVNGTDGGDCPGALGHMKGKKRNPEAVRKSAEAQRGKPRSAETKEKLRQASLRAYATRPELLELRKLPRKRRTV